MSATATTSNANREVCSRACQKHNRFFNQSRTRESSGQQWGPWFPPECPQCVEETAQRVQREEAQRQFDQEVLPILKAGVIARSEKRFEQEEGIEEALAARADELEAQWLVDAWAANRKAFLARAKDEILNRFDQEIIAEEREKFFEQQRGVKAQADAELQNKLDAEREARAKQALASWIF